MEDLTLKHVVSAMLVWSLWFSLVTYCWVGIWERVRWNKGDLKLRDH